MRPYRVGYVALMLCVVAAVACRSDMQDQPRGKPMRPTHFLGEDAPEVPVAGTVSRDANLNDYFNTGYVGNTLGDVIPFPVDRTVLERGRDRYNIYCAPCHSRTGDGNGMIVQRGYRRPPSYHTDRLRKAALGHFFEVMTNGFGAMPDYSAQIDARDRWCIVAYIRALQLSQYAPSDLLPAGQTLSPPPALPGTPGSGATPAEAAPQSGNLEAAEGPPSEVQKEAAKDKKKREQKDREVKRQ